MSSHNSLNEAQVAKELWGREADESVRYGKGFHWVESPLVMAYIQEQITGDPALDWLTYSFQKYVRQDAQRILSLGCGGGALERGLCDLGFRGRIDACDFSQKAIHHAHAMAAQQGLETIHYSISDLNEAEFPSEAYDIIFSGSALHHVTNLEHLLDELRRSLVSQGVLIVNEYVGPFQLQWTPQQAKIIDDLLHLLPPKYRKRISTPGEMRESFAGPSPLHDMNTNDPSEAVRSNEIVSLIEARFAIKEHKNFGGTILHMLLQDIVGNFDPGDCTDAAFLNLLIYIERLLIREGVIDSDFTFLVAEKNRNLIGPGKNYPIDVASELRAREVRIESMQERLRQAEERASVLIGELKRRGQHIANLEDRLDNSYLEEIPGDRGAALQLVNRFRQWKERKLPSGSRRRRIYDGLLKQLRKRLSAG